MPALSVNGLVMPADFPTAMFEGVQSVIRDRARLPDALYSEFAGAWNAVSYRYFAAIEYGESFSQSIKAHGSSPTPMQRYAQERDLFGFFCNGISTLESFYYGAFAIGSHLQPTVFPFASAKDLRRVTPGNTCGAFEKAFPGLPITATLRAVFDDPVHDEWSDIRNVLTHRTAPGRVMYASFGGSDPQLPDEWKLLNIVLDENMTGQRRRGLANLLGTLVGSFEHFVTVAYP